MTSRVQGDGKRGMGAERNTLIRRRIHGRGLGEERNNREGEYIGRKQEEECLFCGFTPYYHKIEGRKVVVASERQQIFPRP